MTRGWTRSARADALARRANEATVDAQYEDLVALERSAEPADWPHGRS